jgi:HAD superfamily phosphatase (TIGR01668 family)
MGFALFLKGMMQPLMRHTATSAFYRAGLSPRHSLRRADQVAFGTDPVQKVEAKLSFYRRWLDLFKPTAKMKRLEDFTPEGVRKLGSFKAIVMDLDDTVAPMLSGKPEPEMVQRLQTLQKSGFQLGIISNNFHKKYCERMHQALQDADLHIHFVRNARKPGSQGYQLMLERMGLEPRDALMVGDSLLSDVWGANRMGMKTVRAKWYTAKGALNWKVSRYLRELLDWAWTGLRCFFTNARKPVWVSEKAGKLA